MRCEQVEELLSAYLDNTLALEEPAESAFALRQEITLHLQECTRCNALLADYRRFDTLLAQMPRVTPAASLRDRIFSSPEYLELTGTFGTRSRTESNVFVPYQQTHRDPTRRPYLVALPGGRSASSETTPSETSDTTAPTRPYRSISRTNRRHPGSLWMRVMQGAIAATILLTLGVGGLIGWRLWQQQNSDTAIGTGITPPAGPATHGPLAAGMRFLFLRDGRLWSTSEDGKTQAQQLTPATVTVATDWTVSPALPGHTAGDLVAYIDLQHAYIHTIRSDGQRDTVIQQPLLKAGILPSSIWDTQTGAAILHSPTWSKDGAMLAFVADPQGTGQTGLYIFSTDTGQVQKVSLPIQGSISQPVWSPDSTRIAFAVLRNRTTSIWDYNIQNQGLLTITPDIQEQGQNNDTLQILDWSPDVNTPTITWSVGTAGQIHSIWMRAVGIGGNAAPQLLIKGNYRQAEYSRTAHNGTGSWLLLVSKGTSRADIWRIDTQQGALPVALTSEKQVNVAHWSPDGTQIDYLDNLSNHIGVLHIISASTARTSATTSNVADEPMPAWSHDGNAIVFSTGTQIAIIYPHTDNQIHTLSLKGPASAFVWTLDSNQTLVVALRDVQQGVYLVDMQHSGSVLQIDQHAIDGPILWSQVP